MSQKKNLPNFFLLLSPAIAFIWLKNPTLEKLYPQAVSFLILSYLALQFSFQRFLKSSLLKRILDFFLLGIIIHLIIFGSGGLLSPFYFLFYFFLFAVAMFMEPFLAILLSFCTSFFLLCYPSKDLFREILQVFSLFLISPLAMIFGSQYRELVKDEEKISNLMKTEKELEEEVTNLVEKYTDKT